MFHPWQHGHKYALLWGLAAFFAMPAAPGWAAHEVESIQVYCGDTTTGSPLTADRPVQCTKDLNVQFTEPDMTGSTDSLEGYVYLWSRSQTPTTSLTRESCVDNVFATPCGYVLSSEAFPTLSADEFKDDDFAGDSGWYFHIVTQYHAEDLVPTYSTPTTSGPYIIDNNISGTNITIVSEQNSTTEITQTSSQSIYILVQPSIDADTEEAVCISTTTATTGTCYSPSDLTGADNYIAFILDSGLADGEEVTIYATFKDQAGNKAIVNKTITWASSLLSPSTATISPNETVLITVNDGGASTQYDWSVSPTDVCTFTAATDGRSATVTGVAAGECTVTATAGSTTLTATVTVKSSFTLDVDGNGASDYNDSMIILSYFFNYHNAKPDSWLDDFTDNNSQRSSNDIINYIESMKLNK